MINSIFKLSCKLCGFLFLISVFSACESQMPPKSEKDMGPFVQAGTEIEAGRYLITVGGCNDCHTDGYLQTEGNIPEDNWLTGSKIGWRGVQYRDSQLHVLEYIRVDKQHVYFALSLHLHSQVLWS